MGFTSYSGPVANFPAITTWASFETIFNNNKTAMEATGDSGPDIGCIWNAVNSAAASIGVDQRVIFCIIMQESTGNVGVGTTDDQDGAATGGLMQCSSSPAFPGQHNLTQDQVNSMVNAGTKHFKGNLEQFGNQLSCASIYPALRAYNSGSVDQSNLSNGLGATDSYVSDIANRLQGKTN